MAEMGMESEELATLEEEDGGLHPHLLEQSLLKSAGPRTHVWRLMRRPPPSLRTKDRRRMTELMRLFQRDLVIPLIEEERLAGVITRSEVLAQGVLPAERKIAVQRLMRKVTPLTDEATVEDAAKSFAEEKLPTLPVVDRQGQVVGMLDDDVVLAALNGGGRVRAASSVPVVDEAMTRAPLVTSREVPLEEAAATMARAGVRHLPVVDDEGRLVGMLSDRDLRERLGRRPTEWFHAAVASLADTVGDAMSHEPIALIAGTWLEAALEIFADEGAGAIPIVDEDERVVGILSYVDVLSWLGRAGARAQSADEFAPTTH